MNHTTKRFTWIWQNQSVDIGYDVFGAGPSLVLLPAFSTVSSRAEMRPLAQALGEELRIIIPDWPGFGGEPTIRLGQSPDLHLAFLRTFHAAVVAGPAMVVAAGHAAGYALRLGPDSWTRIALVAPTWRGPLPTMMGGYRKSQHRVRQAIDMPVIGSALYRLNVANRVIAMMYRRHVFADPGRVTPAFVAEKARIARQRGGRFGTAAFVTGALDPVQDRASFLDSVRRASAPVFVIYGATTPARSLAEMVALSGLPGVLSKCLPAGSLGLHEEHPRGVAELLRPFLLGVPRNLTKADASQVTPAG